MTLTFMVVCVLMMGVTFVMLAVMVGVTLGLVRARRLSDELEVHAEIFAELGLRDAGEGWFAGQFGGREVVVKVVRTARVSGGMGVRLGLGFVALLPLELALEQHVFPNRPQRGRTLGELFYVGAGVPAVLPEGLGAGLVRWVLAEPEQWLELGPRESRALYAGRQLREAASLVRVERGGLSDAAAVAGWLEGCAERVAGLEG